MKENTKAIAGTMVMEKGSNDKKRLHKGYEPPLKGCSTSSIVMGSTVPCRFQLSVPSYVDGTAKEAAFHYGGPRLSRREVYIAGPAARAAAAPPPRR
jgi:hypothetical protein